MIYWLEMDRPSLKPLSMTTTRSRYRKMLHGVMKPQGPYIDAIKHGI